MDVVGIGFAVMDLLYVDGSLVGETLGGTCGNVCCALAALGHATAPVARLGDDAVGSRMTSAFSDVGCDVSLLDVRAGGVTGRLAQAVDSATGRHSFRFSCPETGARYPAPGNVGREAVERALPHARGARVVFVDRLTGPVVSAMEAARASGAVVWLEPNKGSTRDARLFARALAAASVAKFSAEWFPDLASEPPTGCVTVVTDGERGLEVRRGATRVACPAVPAARLVDACGAGDMVTVGAVDAMLAGSGGVDHLASFVDGVRAGQALASENCGHRGARGAFAALGPDGVRALLLSTA